MKQTLRVLIVEDSEDDMLLMLRELRRGEYEIESVRVETSSAMQSALEQQEWDLIVADYTLPTFSAPQALSLLQTLNLDLPFIIVSGTIGEGTAVAAMKAGAHDYLMKGHLARLVPAVERELREAEQRQQRRSAENALRESEQHYRLLFESNPSPMWVFDLETLAFLAVNQAAIAHYGYSQDDFLSMTIIDICPPEEISLVQNSLCTLTPEGKYSGECKHLKKDGKEIDVEILAHTLCFGGKTANLVLVTDVTEKKLLQAQYLRAQRLESLGTLSSGIAHDLNNIFTPILAATQLLPLKNKRLDERSQQLLKLLQESAQRGSNLVKQILSFARGIDGQQGAVQVVHLLREVVDIARHTFPKQIDIEMSLPVRNLWMVLADANQLHQVFMNLLINARDAMTSPGTLSLQAENVEIDDSFASMNIEARLGDYVVITVADTGNGIAPEHIDRVFDPFFTTKPKEQGTGLGLSTVLGIVKSHGGFLTVDSEVDVGTRFKIYLPALKQVEDSAEDESPTDLMGLGELVLIVDDEASIREITKLSLESFNYRVLVAKNGVDAISIYAQYQQEIKFVLLDLMMPDLDSQTVILTLKSINNDVRIVAMSGLSNNEQLFHLKEGEAFLEKPFTAKGLLEKLQQLKS